MHLLGQREREREREESVREKKQTNMTQFQIKMGLSPSSNLGGVEQAYCMLRCSEGDQYEVKCGKTNRKCY